MKTVIVNLYGGPGTGKSTSAAFLFNRLKVAGIEVGLAQEYVKRWAWEARPFGALDEFYFLGKQIREEALMIGKVPFIITDKPVFMDIYYSRKYASKNVADGITAAAMAFYQEVSNSGHKHIHIFLKRSKPYVTTGRYQTEGEAKDMDSEIKDLLVEFGIPFVECDTDDASLLQLLDGIKRDANGE